MDIHGDGLPRRPSGRAPARDHHDVRLVGPERQRRELGDLQRLAQGLEEGGDLVLAPDAVPGRDVAVRAGRPVHVVGELVEDELDVAAAERLVHALDGLDLAVAHDVPPGVFRGPTDARTGRRGGTSRKLCTQPTSWWRWAQAVASARFLTPILMKMLATCRSMVCTLTVRAAAISAFSRPAASSLMTSASRRLSGPAAWSQPRPSSGSPSPAAPHFRCSLRARSAAAAASPCRPSSQCRRAMYQAAAPQPQGTPWIRFLRAYGASSSRMDLAALVARQATAASA